MPQPMCTFVTGDLWGPRKALRPRSLYHGESNTAHASEPAPNSCQIDVFIASIWLQYDMSAARASDACAVLSSLWCTDWATKALQGDSTTHPHRTNGACMAWFFFVRSVRI